MASILRKSKVAPEGAFKRGDEEELLTADQWQRLPLEKRLLYIPYVRAKWSQRRISVAGRKWRGEGENGLKRAVRSCDGWLSLRHQLGSDSQLGDPRDWCIGIYLEIAEEFGVPLDTFIYCAVLVNKKRQTPDDSVDDGDSFSLSTLSKRCSACACKHKSSHFCRVKMKHTAPPACVAHFDPALLALATTWARSSAAPTSPVPGFAETAVPTLPRPTKTSRLADSSSGSASIDGRASPASPDLNASPDLKATSVSNDNFQGADCFQPIDVQSSDQGQSHDQVDVQPCLNADMSVDLLAVEDELMLPAIDPSTVGPPDFGMPNARSNDLLAATISSAPVLANDSFMLSLDNGTTSFVDLDRQPSFEFSSPDVALSGVFGPTSDTSFALN